MSKKLLKNVDWIITVPSNGDIKYRSVDSTKFSIECNGKITTWNLIHNFNGERISSLLLHQILI